MKISLIKKMFTIAPSFISVYSYAAKVPDLPPPGPPPPPPVPLDGGVLLLIVVGLLYGSYKLIQINSLQKK